MRPIVGSVLFLIAVPAIVQALEARDNPTRSPIRECVRIEGVITSIDDATMQIVVDDTLVQVTDSTYIHRGRQAITFQDLVIGKTVAVCGGMEGDVLTACRIAVKCDCG